MFLVNILRAVQLSNTGPSSPSSGSHITISLDEHKELLQYKQLIREQDQQLSALKLQLAQATSTNTNLSSQLAEQTAAVQQLRDQNALLKIQKSVFDSTSVSASLERLASTSSNAANMVRH